MMEWIFKTSFLIIWGFSWGIVYCCVRWYKGERSFINNLDFIAIGLAAISVIAGFKLIYTTWMGVLLSDSVAESEKVYIAYGGLLIIWNGIVTIRKKLI